MNAPLTIYPEAAVDATARGLLASLPLSYAPASNPASADAVVVAGSTGWAERASAYLRDGKRKLIISDPRPDDDAQLRALADTVDALAATVMLSETFAANPATGFIAARLVGTDTITVQGNADAPTRMILFDQVRLARALGITDLTLVDLLDHQASALATLRGTLVDRPVLVRLLAASTTAGVARQVVRGYGFATIVTATLFDAATARPATVRSSGPDSGEAAPTLYENAHRATWRALSAGAISSDLGGFVEDAALLASS